MNLMTENEEANPFEAFDDVAAVLAFCHATLGEAGLRELLALVDCDQESLLRDAAELAEMGLLKASEIVAKAAADALPAAITLCPYSRDDRNNFECWNAAHQRRGLALKGGD